MARKAEESPDERSKGDIEYAVALSRWLLEPVGVWPARRNAKKWERIVANVLATVNFCSMMFLLIPVIVRLYSDVTIGEMKFFFNAIGDVSFHLLGVIKFWTMIVRGKEIGLCLEGLEDDWRRVDCEEDRRLMKRSAKTERSFTILCAGMMCGGAVCYTIALPLLARRIERRNNSSAKILPYPTNYGFLDEESSPTNEILFVAQSITSFVVTSLNVGVYCFVAVCTMHACGQFRIIGRHLERLVEDESVFEMRKRMANIVQRHTRAFRYAENIENTLNAVFLLDVVSCTITICFLEYLFMKDLRLGEMGSTFTYMILIISISFNVFILSFIGQHLKDQSEKVGMVTPFIEWYRLPNEIAENLMLVMLRSSRPARLTAGKLFELSYITFINVTKTSLAYLNLLRTLVT